MPQPDFSNYFKEEKRAQQPDWQTKRPVPKPPVSVGDKWIRAGCITTIVIIGLVVTLWAIGYYYSTP
jgi:hypothetical protein